MLQRKSFTNCVLPFAVSSACPLQLDRCAVVCVPQLSYCFNFIPELFFCPLLESRQPCGCTLSFQASSPDVLLLIGFSALTFAL